MLASCRDRQVDVAIKICENLLRWFVWELVLVVASSIACSLCQTVASSTVCEVYWQSPLQMYVNLVLRIGLVLRETPSLMAGSNWDRLLQFEV
ncbi:hypothetical protein HBI56_147960 [Parastagonospora nodorum]|uniref:Uncharacterized protein n=1 Tax=Phaeosphaeria nodorum (strain SN15 / ATCC MYA-4574 / FGSC 10173) TaxID=321614 RepID=A0A7U2NQN0_PHANO|nr:hypothetical protein HBH56_076890 [Parastagonospora nodorum]QRD06917.1 hypothetical protein JI435_423860 [Parastagonospora nodorum SN15]KAH3923485.1 hypothetical protein HBH54_211060 [Parastagonospora nodorum]KAH3952162.1 hypothetical protein HBH53_051230 [Parastagonospora nodorum]KAH3981674.1 hypothetical protein HBH51_043840 [Parastagonospora nodorum]